jgi:hypothetical protein
MNIENVNWLAIVLAALSGFLIGGLWYSPLMFHKAWSKAANVDTEMSRSSNHLKIFGWSFVFLLIAAINLGLFLADPLITASTGALYGFLTGFGWIAMGFGVTGMFELKSWPYIVINSGYWIVTMTVMGIIIGAF